SSVRLPVEGTSESGDPRAISRQSVLLRHVRFCMILIVSDEERSARWRYVFIGVWTVAVLVQMFGFGSADVDEPGWLDVFVVVFLALAVAAVVGAVRWRPWRYKVALAACG